MPKSEHPVQNAKLRQARLDHGWTQAQVEEALRIGQGLVSIWERGIKHPDRVNQRKLCKLYKATPVELGLVEERPPKPDTPRPLHPQEQPFPSIWNVPYESDPLFTGREALLDQLHTALLGSTTTSLTQVLSGLGGVGKTQLAVEYCYRQRSAYKAILWIQAETPETIMESLVSLATLLHWPRRFMSHGEVLRKEFQAWLQERPHWLVILDNVEDMQTVNDLLPPARRGHVLITTRSQIVSAYSKIEVLDLSADESAVLLLRKSRLIASDARLDQVDEHDCQVAQRIAHLLGGLPLALEQAGAYIDETACSLSHYLERYQTQRALLLHRRGETTSAHPHPEPVTVTFLLSLSKIEQKNPAAADLLRLCSFLAPDAIPEKLFEQGIAALSPELQALIASRERFEDAVVLIRRYSLIRRVVREQHTFSMHRVVQAVIQDTLEAQDQRIPWETQASLAVVDLFSSANTKSIFTNYEPYMPHAEGAAAFLHQNLIMNERVGHFLYVLGHYFCEHARYEQAETVCLDALRLYAHVAGPFHTEVAVQLNSLALVYEEMRQHQKAQRLLVQALTIVQSHVPPQPFAVAILLGNLARCMHFQGKSVTAERLARQALAFYEQAQAPASSDFARALIWLGTILRDQRKDAEAEVLYQRAQKMYTQVLAPDHPDVGHALEAQGTFYFLQNNYEQAELLYTKARGIFEAAWGKDHPTVASCLYHLADCALHQGRFAQAEQLNRRAWAIYETVGGPDYLEINQPLQGLAMQYYRQEKYEESEHLFQRAINLIEKSQGPEHSDLVPALSNLANLYLKTGDWLKAQQLKARAYAIERKRLSE